MGWGLLGLILVTKLVGLWDPPSLRYSFIGLYLAVTLGTIASRLFKASELARPAAVADDRADLKDELKSALDFLEEDEPHRTPWMSLQVQRAASRVDTLDRDQLEPRRIPRGLPIAFIVAGALFSLFNWGPSGFRELEIDFSAPQLRASLDDAEDPGAADPLPTEPELFAPQPEELEPDLPEAQFPVVEALPDLAETQQALAASQADMEVLEAALEELGSELQSSASLSELSDALRSQDAQRASELLRELAEKIGDPQTAADLEALLDSLGDAGEMDEAQMAQLLENLEQATQNLENQSAAEAQQAMMDAAQQMEAMGEQLSSQQQGDAAMQMQMQGPAGQQQAGQESSQSQQSQSQSGDTAAAAMSGGQAQLASANANASAVPMDAGPSGNATGQGSEEAVFGESSSLEVQLEMELLQQEDREPVPEEVFDKQSREEQSVINYETIRERGSYAEEDALSAEKIPWRYRDLVKRYFLTMRSRSKP